MQIPDQVLQIIRHHYLDISEESITYTHGNDHDVYIVNKKIAFRFPKVPREINPNRSQFLQELAVTSPLPLPTIEIHTDNNSGLQYEINNYLPGVSFYPEVAKNFSHEELMIVAKKLGEFLSAVHLFPLDRAKELQLDELNPHDFWDYMQNNPNAFPYIKKNVYPQVSEEEQIWIEKMFTDFISLAKEKPLPLKVIHADIWTYHIIVDPDIHTLSGVIDFWGRISDPANDFKAFEYYGKDFVKEVYKNYTLDQDEDFEKRRLFYTAHDEVFEFARQLEKGDKKMIEKHKKSLTNYIHSHPLQ